MRPLACGVWILALSALADSAHAPAPDAWISLSAPDRQRALAGLSRKPLPDRVLEVSRRFLNTPYVTSPLGEGSGPDPDPTFRLDAVDCLTFVEETIALAISDPPDRLPGVLEQIRYAQKPVYEDRNHLMEAQWLPHNVAKGFIREVTAQYGGNDTEQATKRITRATWQSASSRALGLPDDHHPEGVFPLNIIPLDKVRSKAASIPSGTIFVVVREERPFKVTRITHLGFIVQKGKHTFLRHAARSVFVRVVDEDLENFLERNARYEKWKVSGVALFEVTAPRS